MLLDKKSGAYCMNLVILYAFPGRHLFAFGRELQNDIIKLTEYLTFCKESKRLGQRLLIGFRVSHAMEFRSLTLPFILIKNIP